MDTIVTRFPPSPTGFLHIGGARTALFNWLYARKTRGRFVLRIEDTDEQRSTAESVDAILDALEWLGIDFDDGPYYQTRRHEIYAAHTKRLIDEGHAYYCSCTAEEIDAMRQEARAAGKKPMYNNKCRDLGLSEGKNRVVRLKTPDTGVTVVEDIVKGDTAFQNQEVDDFIIQRSDGSFMYNLAVVVDDLTMGVNTIIRGDDHLINTPKQIMIYRALGAALPVFAHVPMVLGSDRSRLSKRHGAMSVSEYRSMGYLPDAMINYLVRLGWSHGDQEFFEREELIEKFDLAHLGRSAAMFDPDRLSALNAKHIQAKSAGELGPHLLPYLESNGIDAADDDFLHEVIKTLQPRSRTLVDMAQSARFYFADNIEYDEAAAKKFLTEKTLKILETTLEAISDQDEFTLESLESAFKQVMEKTGLGFGKIAQPVRVAVTGTTVSPGIFEMLLVLGREKTLARIKAAADTVRTG